MRLFIKAESIIMAVILAALALSLAVPFVGCTHPAAEDTYMVDMSSERDVSIPQTCAVAFLNLTECEYRALAALTQGKYKYDGLMYGKLDDEESAKNAAKRAVKDFFGNDFIDMGSERKAVICKSESDENVWACYNGTIYAALKADTGELLVCLDSRIRGRFDMKAYIRDKSVFDFKADIYDYSADELKFYYMINIDNHYVQPKHEALPTAQSAYEAAAAIAKSISWGSLSGNGRKYIVYFSGNSNAWIVVGTKNTIALSKETGEMLLIGRTIK